MTDIPTRPAPHPATETAFLQDEVVVLDTRSGHVAELNPSASAVWLLLDGELSVDDVVADLHELVGVPEDAVRSGVLDAVSEFARLGLLADSELVDHAGDAEGVDGRVSPGSLVVLARPPDP